MSDDDRNHDHDETMQRINQANSAAGAPALMPGDWAATAALGDELNRSMFLELPHDHNPVAQRMAGHMVKEHIKAWDAAGKRSVYTRWCPEHDESRSDTLATLYALSYSGDPAYIVAMQDLSQ